MQILGKTDTKPMATVRFLSRGRTGTVNGDGKRDRSNIGCLGYTAFPRLPLLDLSRLVPRLVPL